jgi:hypothetical protein
MEIPKGVTVTGEHNKCEVLNMSYVSLRTFMGKDKPAAYGISTS